MGVEQHQLRVKAQDIDLWRYVRAMPEYADFAAMERAAGYAIVRRTGICCAITPPFGVLPLLRIAYFRITKRSKRPIL